MFIVCLVSSRKQPSCLTNSSGRSRQLFSLAASYYGQLLLIPKVSTHGIFHCIRKIYYIYISLILVKYLFKVCSQRLNFVFLGIIFESLETLNMVISLTGKAMITFVSSIVSPKYICKILHFFKRPTLLQKNNPQLEYKM